MKNRCGAFVQNMY